MEILVHSSAPDEMKTERFWLHFLRGTHWRNVKDNAEIVITEARTDGWGNINSCRWERFNNKYSIMGNQVRDFPMREWTSFNELAQHGFIIVPNEIQGDPFFSSRNDKYFSGLNNLGWGDNSLHRPNKVHSFPGLTNKMAPNTPIAMFSIGIPPGRIISLKGLVIGNDRGPNYCYNRL